MPTASQRKNAWRSRRREALRNGAGKDRPPISANQACKLDAEAEIVRARMTKWALAVIQYYCTLWDFAKITPLMTRHKHNRLKDLIGLGNYRGIFDNWIKAGGHICYYIDGVHKDHLIAHGTRKETSMVQYDFFDTAYGPTGRYVLTNSGSFYHLHNHTYNGTPEEFSIEQEKKHNLMQFRILYGVPPRRPT